MRLGKPIEHLNTLVKSLSISDDVLRVLAVGRAASLAIYLFFDMLQWAHGAGLYKFQDVRSIGQKAARFWLIGLALNILAGIYRHRQISMRVDTTQKAIREQNRSGVVNETTRQELRNARKELSSTRRQLLQDCLDILIPSTTLNYTGLNDGLVGLAGTITSLMGIRSQWNKVCAK
jgi:peroxin-11B